MKHEEEEEDQEPKIIPVILVDILWQHIIRHLKQPILKHFLKQVIKYKLASGQTTF